MLTGAAAPLGCGAFAALCFASVTSIAWSIELPQGYGKAKWGMTVEELKKVAKVTNAVKEGKRYAEHFESSPDVYVSDLPYNNRVEYYFYKKKLYKVFIVYTLKESGFSNPLKYYKSIVDMAISRYGKPKSSFEDNRFGFPIWHNLWEDNSSQLDFRLGNPFIHQVLINKKMVKEKLKGNKRKKEKKKEFQRKERNEFEYI